MMIESYCLLNYLFFLNSYKWHLIIFDIMHKTFAYDYISVIFKNYKNSIEIFNYM